MKTFFYRFLLVVSALCLAMGLRADKVTGPLIRNSVGDGYATHYNHTGYGGYVNVDRKSHV